MRKTKSQNRAASFLNATATIFWACTPSLCCREARPSQFEKTPKSLPNNDLRPKTTNITAGGLVLARGMLLRISFEAIQFEKPGQKAMARGAFNERVFRTVALPLIVRAANLGWHVEGPLFFRIVFTNHPSPPLYLPLILTGEGFFL